MNFENDNFNRKDDNCDICGEIEFDDNQLILCDYQYQNGKTCQSQVHKKCYDDNGININNDPFYCHQHRLVSNVEGDELIRLEKLIKEKVDINIDDASLKTIMSIVVDRINKPPPSSSSSSSSSLTSSISSSAAALSLSSSSSSSLSSSSSSIVSLSPLSSSPSSSSSSSFPPLTNLFTLYGDRKDFKLLTAELFKNDMRFFEECVSSCTTYDENTKTHTKIEMMGVRAKEDISSKKRIIFGLHWGQIIPRSDFIKYKQLKYKAYAESLRALSVGNDQILLVDFNCLAGCVNSASSSMFKATRCNGEPLIPKIRLIQAANLPGVHYYETMNIKINKNEEIHTLYYDEINNNSQSIEDDIEALRVSLTRDDDDDDDDDNERNDPSITLSQLSQTSQ
jgi:hypothetical protein